MIVALDKISDWFGGNPRQKGLWDVGSTGDTCDSRSHDRVYYTRSGLESVRVFWLQAEWNANTVCNLRFIYIIASYHERCCSGCNACGWKTRVGGWTSWTSPAVSQIPVVQHISPSRAAGKFHSSDVDLQFVENEITFTSLVQLDVGKTLACLQCHVLSRFWLRTHFEHILMHCDRPKPS